MSAQYPPKDQQMCGSCYYVRTHRVRIGADQVPSYRCHARTPADADPRWPAVQPTDWCGHWAPEDLWPVP